MNDHIGRVLEVGDYVILIDPNYRKLQVASVTGFTKKKVKVKYKNTRLRPARMIERLEFPINVSKLDNNPDLMLFMLSR